MVTTITNFYRVCKEKHVECTLLERHGISGAFHVSDVSQLTEYVHEGNTVFIGPYYDVAANRHFTPKPQKLSWENTVITKLIEQGKQYRVLTRRVCDSNELIADSNLGIHGWTLIEVEGKKFLAKNNKTISFRQKQKMARQRSNLLEQRILMCVWQQKDYTNLLQEWCACNNLQYKHVDIKQADVEQHSIGEVLYREFY